MQYYNYGKTEIKLNVSTENNKTQDNFSHLSKSDLWAFNKSWYWGYTPPIPERWCGMRILEELRG